MQPQSFTHDEPTSVYARIDEYNGLFRCLKYVADDFGDNMGVVTGIVGLAGGIGGFLLPIIFGMLLDFFRVRSTCFMFLYGIVWVSLILIYLSEVRQSPVLADH